MYGREIGGTTYTFEPSGGLLNASLVMQDKESDSYWSIITDQAVHGAAEGKKLSQLPGAAKVTWGEWKKRHPSTKILSVGGKEHDPRASYEDYFSSDRTFRDLQSRDDRLENKALLFTFHHRGEPYAVPFPAYENGGGVFELDGRQLFVYRQKDDSFYRSTVAYLAPEGVEFQEDDGLWHLVQEGRSVARFDPESRTFGDGAPVETFTGFDTYWYIWSLTNPRTEILGS